MTHREALSQIRIDTSTSPKGLIHMLTIDRATCIVFSIDDPPSKGVDHTCALHIFVSCFRHLVPYVLLDNDSALNAFPLSITIALRFGPSDFGLST